MMTQVYSREFQAMLDSLDEEDGREESGGAAEKKRRLSTDQVKALERNFAVENKLEPERKVKLAEELGLQPRQVAIWFQNRRARWKTKQLERDYGVLKSDYDSLKLNFTDLERENRALTLELTKLKRKLQDQSTDTSHSDKESPTSESETNLSDQSKKHDLCDNGSKQFKGHADSKDGLSDSDSNAIIKEDSNANAPILISPPSSSSPYHFKWPQIMGKAYQCQLVKVEEQSLFSTEESCNFFSVDQAPSLHWYFPEQ